MDLMEKVKVSLKNNDLAVIQGEIRRCEAMIARFEDRLETMAARGEAVIMSDDDLFPLERSVTWKNLQDWRRDLKDLRKREKEFQKEARAARRQRKAA